MPICFDKCSGKDSERQRNLLQSELNDLPESAKKAISESRGIVYRCSYCGCVYLNGPNVNEKLGDLDGSMTGIGWRSEIYK
jgi:hypothetical protein